MVKKRVTIAIGTGARIAPGRLPYHRVHAGPHTAVEDEF